VTGRSALWLTARDLATRPARVALAAAVIAAIVAAATALELVARGREDAIAARIDEMGPALTVVPPGVGAGALARHVLGDGLLPADAARRVGAALGGDLRAVEARLVVASELEGRPVSMIGIDAREAARSGPAPGTAALGAELARRLGGPRSIRIGERELPVSGVRPSAGDAEDLAVFLPLAEAQAIAGVTGVNALRVYLRAGVAPARAEAALRGAALGGAVVRTDRGEVADGGAQAALARHRLAAYAAMAVVAALCLLIAAHLDAAERRVELATLIAIGASRRTVLGTLLSRAAAVAATGAILGVALGVVIAAGQDGTALSALARAWPVAGATFAAALALGVAAAAPTAIAAATRDPVRELQES
jgi:putative ABC transport system permease protein